jgi:5-methylcytosine-specific restriction endonuclease McrA
VCGQLFTKPSGNQKRCDVCVAAGFVKTERCVGCDTVYFSRRLAGRFCSRSCHMAARYPDGAGPSRKNHRNRAKFFGVRYEQVDRLEVFARDGWFCLLCVTPVDPALRWPHLMSASLDHVVPMSRGGDHSYRNVQTAHLSCNIAKGNGAGRAAA